MSWPKLRRIARALKHFGSEDGYLPRDEDLETLVPVRGRGSLLLGFYSPDDVRDALERYGLAAELGRRGFSDLRVELSTVESERQVVRVRGSKNGSSHLLGETILRDDTFVSEADFAGTLRGRPLRMLFLQWVRLQDPTRGFSPDRPRLPGQAHPGLGVGREVMTMFLGLAERLGFGGIMVCPEFAHNARLYSAHFRFFDPGAQGRYEALAEAGRGLSLAEFAWGVEKGCVVEETSGRTFSWFHEEMLRATGGVIVDYLESDDYARRVEQARSRCRLRFDTGRLRALELPPDDDQV